MSLDIKPKEKMHLKPLIHFNPEDIISMCKVAFEYLENVQETKNIDTIRKAIAAKYNKELLIEEADVQCIIEALISLLVEATINNSNAESIHTFLFHNNFNANAIEILSQFLCSKRNFVMSCIRMEDIDYHLIDLDWRLEIRLASRSLLKQSTICITMKLYLHTESRSQYRPLLVDDTSQSCEHLNEWNKAKRKDILVQMDLNSLKYMISVLEQALLESRTRRIRNIVTSLH